MALAVFLLATIVFWVINFIALKHFEKLSKKTKTDIDDTVIEIIKSLKPPFYIFLAFYIGISFLSLHYIADKVVTAILLFWIILQVSTAAGILVKFAVRKYVHNGEDDEHKVRGANQFLSILVRIVIWSFGLLWILSNLGIDITSLVAGLGIGGIAVAFALQNILSDLFSSFAIHFDKPFQVGDYIVVGDKSGTVEKIGIKTTRVRALQGEEIVFSNKELTSIQIQNFKKLKERRVSFQLGVEYSTPNKKLESIPAWIQKIIESEDKLRFDRVHFVSFGDSALIFEIVFYILSPEYSDYVDSQQSINLKIKDIFESEGIEIAYPTQTLHIKKN